jgi:hypothetical protein
MFGVNQLRRFKKGLRLIAYSKAKKDAFGQADDFAGLSRRCFRRMNVD